jgi:hypothetical protein
LHVLAVNSIQSLFNYFTEQLENTPTLAEIQATNKMPDKVDENEAQKKETSTVAQKETGPPHPPLYVFNFEKIVYKNNKNFEF